MGIGCRLPVPDTRPKIWTVVWIPTPAPPSAKIKTLSIAVRLSHTHTVVRECFKGDEASQWKRPKFDPSPRQNPLTKIGVVDNAVDVTRHAKFYRAPFRGFWSPYTWFSVPSVVVFNAFLSSCNSLQPTPLNGFLRKIRQNTSFRPRMCLLGGLMTTINM